MRPPSPRLALMPALRVGTRLGPYEILDAIGAGGMGEVYRARDTRLDRLVAIKVLASALASDVPSRERFEREARAISSLNHPNICGLYDVGRERPAGAAGADEAPVDFLVMEYVEGETLAARLARGPSRATRNAALGRGEAPSDPTAAPSPAAPGVLPPMTVDEALAVAIQIAGALDCAHRLGIVHRDLKPGNVMLVGRAGAPAPASIVKLLDFGLARFSRPGSGTEGKAGPGHGLASLADQSMPTVSSPLTMKGTILGTLQYMSPEQLEGKEVDARADIFTFGGVLYEMLTGRRPFEGKSQASLISAILDHQPPPVASFQPLSPAMLDEIVARCLVKDPDERWQSARDLKRQLEWVAKQVPHVSVAAVAIGGATPVAPPAAARMARVGAAVLVGAVVAGTAAWMFWPQTPPVSVPTRFSVELPEGQTFGRSGRHLVALSPDGATLVYVANQQLNLRKMGELTAVPISGTEKSDPSEPIFSPDGQWVAFFSVPTNELKKVPVTGGTPVTLAAAQNPFGGSWTGDRILLGQASPRGIVEVLAGGGTAKLLVGVDESKDESAHGPQLLAGGRAVLFTLRAGSQVWDASTIVVHELATGRRTALVKGGTDARVLPTGHLVYFRDGTLFAVPFDEERMTVIGGAVPVQMGIQQAVMNLSGAVQAAWSDSGAMAYVPSGASGFNRELLWLNRQGQLERTTAPQRPFVEGDTSLALSPDGTRAAVQVLDGAVRDLWVWTVARGELTRLTFTGEASLPVWTQDGRRICYNDTGEAFCQAADGSGKPVSLFKFPGLYSLGSMSPDGTRVVFSTVPETGHMGDIMMATLGPPVEIRPLIKSRFREATPRISPDGRWIAYESDESGRSEVFVRPFPEVDQGRWQVSTEGGEAPRWAKNGRELFFDASGRDGRPRSFWSSTIQPGGTFVAGKPTLFATSVSANVRSPGYDVAPDGRLLIHANESRLTAVAEASRPHVVVVQHWFDELKARASVAARRN